MQILLIDVHLKDKLEISFQAATGICSTLQGDLMFIWKSQGMIASLSFLL